MHGARMWHTLRLYTMRNAFKRTQYFKDNDIFHSMGDDCLITDRVVPLYSKLISLGNNVHLASGVHFVTHDVTHSMLNRSDKALSFSKGKKYSEKVGCIDIGDNVFIGSGTYITYNVKIGSNVIIGACSLVNKDVPDNCVVAGVPAKVIKSFDVFLEKRSQDEAVDRLKGERLSPDTVMRMWAQFYEERKKK